MTSKLAKRLWDKWYPKNPYLSKRTQQSARGIINVYLWAKCKTVGDEW